MLRRVGGSPNKAGCGGRGDRGQEAGNAQSHVRSRQQVSSNTSTQFKVLHVCVGEGRQAGEGRVAACWYDQFHAVSGVH